MNDVFFRVPRFLLLVIILIAGLPALASAQVAARLIAPANGGSDVEPRVTFAWNAVPGALAYYLYVGTSPGAKNVADTGEIQATQYPAPSLAGNTTLHARLHTKFTSGWKSSDISFTTRPVSMLTSPRHQGVNIVRRPTFQWTRVAGASAYYLYVGTTPGAKDVVDTGELQTLSFQPTVPLPATTTLFARMHVLFNGAWRYTETTFTTAATAIITTPTDGAMDVDTRQPLTWSGVTGAQVYYVYVGTTQGAKDLIDSGETAATSHSIAVLPGGKTVFARLYTKHQDAWRFTEISFTTRAAARLLSPEDGAQNIAPDQLATWTTTDNAMSYYLTAGSSPGGREYIDTGEINATSYPLSALPAGVTVHLRLYTHIGQAWKFIDATITTDARARIVAPLAGQVDVARHSQIVWSTAPGATAYYLYVGNTPGAKDLINTGEIAATSYPADSLPPGRMVYARIWTKRDNLWKYSDATFTTSATAVLEGSWPASAQIDPATTLQWQPLAAADSYYVYVGSTPGGKDWVDSGEITSPSYSLLGLPGGRTYYVRLYTRVNGSWRFEEYSVQLAPVSRLTVPAAGSVEVELERLSLAWTPVDGATAYRVALGTTLGASDLWTSGDLAENTTDVPPMPGGRTLHVRIWAKQADVWRATDAHFQGQAVSQLKYPVQRSTTANLSQPFRWTDVAGASAYSLGIGSTPGGSDLLNSGAVTTTALTAANLPVAQPLYVRVGVLIDTKWRYLDTVVRASGVAPPVMTYPVSNLQSIDAATPFEWTRDPLAISYRLAIGTSSSAHDLHDSGPLRVARRFVAGLPVGQTLHATLQASYSDAASAETHFTFVVGSASIPTSAYIAAAKQGAAYVRSMARVDNVAFGNTVLADIRRTEGASAVDCVSYAMALLVALGETGVALPARTLGICLNPNTFDCHTLIELFDPDVGRWLLLDPTFALVVRRAADGDHATSADVSAAARAFDWTMLQYEFLSPSGNGFATGYYLDYPTMFVNVYRPSGQGMVEEPPATILPYYEPVASTVSATPGSYALQCGAGQNTVSALLNGTQTSLSCSSADNLTHIFFASSIQPLPSGEQLTVYRVRRFTF